MAGGLGCLFCLSVLVEEDKSSKVDETMKGIASLQVVCKGKMMKTRSYNRVRIVS